MLDIDLQGSFSFFSFYVSVFFPSPVVTSLAHPFLFVLHLPLRSDDVCQTRLLFLTAFGSFSPRFLGLLLQDEKYLFLFLSRGRTFTVLSFNTARSIRLNVSLLSVNQRSWLPPRLWYAHTTPLLPRIFLLPFFFSLSSSERKKNHKSSPKKIIFDFFFCDGYLDRIYLRCLFFVVFRLSTFGSFFVYLFGLSHRKGKKTTKKKDLRRRLFFQFNLRGLDVFFILFTPLKMLVWLNFLESVSIGVSWRFFVNFFVCLLLTTIAPASAVQFFCFLFWTTWYASAPFLFLSGCLLHHALVFAKFLWITLLVDLIGAFLSLIFLYSRLLLCHDPSNSCLFLQGYNHVYFFDSAFFFFFSGMFFSDSALFVSLSLVIREQNRISCLLSFLRLFFAEDCSISCSAIFFFFLTMPPVCNIFCSIMLTPCQRGREATKEIQKNANKRTWWSLKKKKKTKKKRGWRPKHSSQYQTKRQKLKGPKKKK